MVALQKYHDNIIVIIHQKTGRLGKISFQPPGTWYLRALLVTSQNASLSHYSKAPDESEIYPNLIST